MQIFVDSDVVISSLISSSGAAHYLIAHPKVKPIISNHSFSELSTVVSRLHIDLQKLNTLTTTKIHISPISLSLDNLKQKYHTYATDINDAHIIAATHLLKIKYLITYNQKHFKINLIKDDLNILVMTPAMFLQYLRSL